LADAIRDVKTRIKALFDLLQPHEQDPCDICSNASRDQGLVCVVEQPKDLLALEGTGLIPGRVSCPTRADLALGGIIPKT